MVILVNDANVQTGIIKKTEAHKESLLHRSSAVFIFNSLGKLMIQQRSMYKTTSPGLWSTTCQTHPRPGETALAAAHRSLNEDLGFDCSFHNFTLCKIDALTEDNIFEKEINHMYIGISNQLPKINPREVNSYKLMTPSEIKEDITFHPEKYTDWFKVVFNKAFRMYPTLFR